MLGLLAVGGCAGGVLLGHAEVKLLDPEYKFGIIRETDGEQTGVARLVNVGDTPTYIRDVRPSCGCTGAAYNDNLLQPGDTTTVSFTYNPAGRPGKFTKTVKVYVGDGEERHVIRLTGNVVGSAATLSRNYPVECGPLRLAERTVDLRDVRQSAGRHAFVRIINQSMDTVRPEWEYSNPALSLDVAPEVIPPGEVATFGIFLNSRFEKQAGRVEYRIPFHAAGDSTYVDIVVRANILPADTIVGQAF